MAEVAGLRARIETLKDWIRSEASRTDTCAYHILGREICENCQCGRVAADRKPIDATPHQQPCPCAWCRVEEENREEGLNTK